MMQIVYSSTKNENNSPEAMRDYYIELLVISRKTLISYNKGSKNKDYWRNYRIDQTAIGLQFIYYSKLKSRCGFKSVSSPSPIRAGNLADVAQRPTTAQMEIFDNKRGTWGEKEDERELIASRF